MVQYWINRQRSIVEIPLDVTSVQEIISDRKAFNANVVDIVNL